MTANNTSKELNVAIVLWLLASLFYAYQYLFRVFPGLLVNEISDTFNIQASQFGSLGIYYIAYGLVHIPLGVLVDRFSVKNVIPICILLCALGNAPLIFSESWGLTIFGRVLVGVGSSGASIALFKIISMYFTERVFTRMLGIAVAFGLLGAMFGGAPLQAAFTHYNWQVVLKYIIIFGLILAVVTYIVSPKESHEVEEREQSLLKDMKMIFTSKPVLLLGFFGGLMIGPMSGFADLWGKEYLLNVYEIEENTAALLPSLVFFGMIFGCMIVGYVTNKTGAYYGISIFAAIGMGAIFVWILSGQCTCNIMYVLFTIVGILSAYQIVIIYKATTYMPARLSGITSAVANSLIMAFGSLFHQIIGKVMSMHAVTVGDATVYSNQAFTKALAVIPAALIIAAIGLIALRAYDKKAANVVIED